MWVGRPMAERGRIHLLLEGQTEETITREIISPHLARVRCGASWWGVVLVAH